MTHSTHTVKTRTNQQTSRPGWRPAKTSHAKLVRDIVTSIQAKRAAGRTTDATDSTSDVPTIAAIEALLTSPTLRHVQPAEAQATRRQQQAHLDKGRTTTTPDCSKPCTGCSEPTTHGLLCTGCEDMRWSAHDDELAEECESNMEFAT